MPGQVHRVMSWLRLGLTSLALALGAVPAHALPAHRAEVTLSVERIESVPQRAAPEAPAHSAPAARRFLRVHAHAESSGWLPEARPPGPPLRLFLVHRALLR